MNEPMVADELAELRQLCDRAEELGEDPKSAIYDAIDARTECGRALPRAIREIERLRAELDRLRGLMLGEGEVKHMMYSPEKGCEVEIEHWAVKHVAASLLDTLGDAPNFATMTVSHPERGAVEIVVRRPEGKPVATVQAELRAEIERLRKRCEEQDWTHDRITELAAENDKLRAELANRPKLWAIKLPRGGHWPSGSKQGTSMVAVYPADRREDAEARAYSSGGTVVEYTGAENE